MPSYDVKNYTQSRSLSMAGRMSWFREKEGGERRIGRVVGYYYDMAQMVMECSFSPEYAIDPRAPHIKLVADLQKTSGWQYATVGVFLVDEEVRQKSARYPHACPRCGTPALIFFRTVECSNFACLHYKP